MHIYQGNHKPTAGGSGFQNCLINVWPPTLRFTSSDWLEALAIGETVSPWICTAVLTPGTCEWGLTVNRDLAHAICFGQPKYPFDSLYFDIPFISVDWNWTHNTSKVCLYGNWISDLEIHIHGCLAHSTLSYVFIPSTVTLKDHKTYWILSIREHSYGSKKSIWGPTALTDFHLLYCEQKSVALLDHRLLGTTQPFHGKALYNLKSSLTR